jgi:osmotically-inducible protein OsmY
MNISNLKRTLIATAVLGALGTTANAAESFAGDAQDAWLTGKIETVYALNEHLNPFAIDTDVDNGIVHLTGTVESEIDRDLAEALAAGIEGVIEVDNDLVVGAAEHDAQQAADGGRRDFGTWVDDATTTAAVKSRLIGNDSTNGLQIDVDTNNDVVTLSGRVDSDEERDLAEEIARNATDVADVHNNLVVDPS